MDHHDHIPGCALFPQRPETSPLGLLGVSEGQSPESFSVIGWGALGVHSRHIFSPRGKLGWSLLSGFFQLSTQLKNQ